MDTSETPETTQKKGARKVSDKFRKPRQWQFVKDHRDKSRKGVVMELVKTHNYKDVYRPMLATAYGMRNIGNMKRLNQLGKLLGFTIRSPYYLLYLTEVAWLLGVKKSFVKRLVLTGRIGFVQPSGPGGQIFIPVAALELALLYWSCGNIPFDHSEMVRERHITNSGPDLERNPYNVRAEHLLPELRKEDQ